MNGGRRGWAARALTALADNPLPVDLVACTCLAAGVASALLSITALPADIGSCLVVALAASVLVAICTLRWWVAPGLVLLGVGTALAVGAGMQRLREWGVYLTSFFFWLLAGAPAGELYAENGSYRLLQVLVVFGCALVVYLLVRGLFLYPALALGVAAVLVYAAFASRGDVSAQMCLCAVGLGALLPRVYAARLVRGGAGAQEEGRDTVRHNAPPRALRARMQSIGLLVAAVAVGLALLVTPQDTTVWKSSTLTLLAEDISRMLEGPFARSPSYTSNYSLESLGFGSDTGRLGGPARLKDTAALSVEAAAPVLLKGRVLDRYTGDSWAIGAADGDLRYNSFFWRGYRNDAFGRNLPAGGGEAARLYDKLTEEVELEVRHRGRGYNSVFYTGTLQRVELIGLPEGTQTYFNLRGELYLHQRLSSLSGYTLTTRVWNTGAEGFEEDFLALEAACAARRDNGWEVVAARYLALPDTLPAQVPALAETIAAGEETPYQKAVAIAGWLAENCSYTLEPAPLPQGEDFVAHFLETRQGYCTYYATAMAVLARCAGLPSRYVEGFALQGEKDDFVATGRTAHAWAEVYFHGIGWMTFDPLDWDAAAPLNVEPEVEEEEPAAVGGGEMTPEPVPPEYPVVELPPLEPVPQRGSAVAGLVVLAALVGAALLLWLASRYIAKSKLRAYTPRRVARRYLSPADQLMCYYRDTLRQLELAGAGLEPGETLTTYALAVDRRLRFEGGSFGPVAEAVNLLLFAEKRPTEEQVAAAARYHLLLEKHLMEIMGQGRYFLTRALPHHPL